MTDDFAVYDVPTTCRMCGCDFMSKSFAPPSEIGIPRYGLCPECLATDDAKMRALTDPHPRHPKRPTPERVDFRRRAAGDD